MGYVKITGEFTDRVRSVIRRMKDAELRETEVGEVKVDSPEHKVLLEIGMKEVWGDHLHLKDQMPERWRGESDHIEFQFVNADGVNFHSDNIYITEDRGFPPGMSRWSSPTVKMAVDDDTPAVVMDWLKRVQDTLTKRAEIVEKFQTIQTQVTNFLRKHTSLNTAIKELPEIEMYIDSDDMERLHRKAVRGAPVPAEKEEADEGIGLDVELLTGTAVAHRIKNSR